MSLPLFQCLGPAFYLHAEHILWISTGCQINNSSYSFRSNQSPCSTTPPQLAINLCLDFAILFDIIAFGHPLWMLPLLDSKNFLQSSLCSGQNLYTKLSCLLKTLGSLDQVFKACNTGSTLSFGLFPQVPFSGYFYMVNMYTKFTTLKFDSFAYDLWTELSHFHGIPFFILLNTGDWTRDLYVSHMDPNQRLSSAIQTLSQ